MFGGLRGRRLSLAVGFVGAVGFMLQGFDQAVANGLLTLNSFVKTFPQMDTVNTSGAVEAHNSLIQGMFTIGASWPTRASKAWMIAMAEFDFVWQEPSLLSTRSDVLWEHSRVLISVIK